MQLSPLDCLKNSIQAPPPKLLDAIPGLGTHSKLSPSLPSCFQSGLLHFSIQIILLPECPAAPEGIVYPKKGPYIQETPPTHPPLQGGTRVPNPPSLLISGSSERCCWQPPSLKKKHTGIPPARNSGWPSALTEQGQLRAQGLSLPRLE